MPSGDKPYRVYRGGRAKGKVPSATARAARAKREARGDARRESRTDYRGPGARQKEVRWGRRFAIGAAVLLILVVVWAVASWFAFSSGVSDANKRLDPNAKAALTPQSGLLLSHSTTVLSSGIAMPALSHRLQAGHILPGPRLPGPAWPAVTPGMRGCPGDGQEDHH